MKAVSHNSWKSLLENNDAASLWQSLHRLVSIHPLVRSVQRNQHNARNSTSLLSLPDLTQDLYLLLLEKSRFNHYVQREMTDAEIEREIFQVELTNMMIGRLRRRQPENYRMVRRISGILESDSRLRIIRQPESHQTARYRQAVNVIYGLREWSNEMSVKDSATFEELIANVPIRIRNRRLVGCKGDAQVIVSNQELADLLIEIFQAINSPTSLRTLRSLALTKLPVYDAVVSSLDQATEQNEHHQERLLISPLASPEQINLRREEEQIARRAAHDFLARIDRMMRFRPERTEKLWRILWHYYFDTSEPSQLSIAAMLKMSDSSVSDYRRKMEHEMQRLLQTEASLEQMSHFADELSVQLKSRLAMTDETRRLKTLGKKDFPAWNKCNYASLATLERMPTV